MQACRGSRRRVGRVGVLLAGVVGGSVSAGIGSAGIGSGAIRMVPAAERRPVPAAKRRPAPRIHPHPAQSSATSAITRSSRCGDGWAVSTPNPAGKTSGAATSTTGGGLPRKARSQFIPAQVSTSLPIPGQSSRHRGQPSDEGEHLQRRACGAPGARKRARRAPGTVARRLPGTVARRVPGKRGTPGAGSGAG